jgi:hypothetical protein
MTWAGKINIQDGIVGANGALVSNNSKISLKQQTRQLYAWLPAAHPCHIEAG